MPQTPDLASAGFYPFPKPKTPMKGKRFATIKEVKEKSKQDLLSIPKSVFQKYFEDWKNRWRKYIISEGFTLKGLRQLLINK